jgi:hypothetical protein
MRNVYSVARPAVTLRSPKGTSKISPLISPHSENGNWRKERKGEDKNKGEEITRR